MKPLLREIWRSDRRAFLTILGWNIGISLLSGIGIVMLVPLFVESMYKKIWNEIDAKGKTEAFKKLMKFSNTMLKAGIDLRRTLFKSIHDVFGGKLQKMVCGGAPIRKELGDFFDTIGITLIHGYGITECSPLVAVNRDYFYDFASVGVKLPCVEIKIDQPN